MTIQTNLHGRLRNTSLPYSHGLLPVFEAVVNSIHSIEEQPESQPTGRIVLEVIRLPQSNMELSSGDTPKEEIVGFEIQDDGVGFNNTNLESFRTLDSDYKAEKGCRGVGRLLWLKAFNRVDVSSVFFDGNGFTNRNFAFDRKEGVGNPIDTESPKKTSMTTVSLNGFKEKYRKATPKTTRSIAMSLLEHCLWYFIRDGGCPKVLVKDGSESIDLDQLYDSYMFSSATSESFLIKDKKFFITHIKCKSTSSKNHTLSYCAANRLVKDESLVGKIPGLTGKMGTDDDSFVYSCYVASPYLDEKVRSERTGFDFIENDDDIFYETEISLKEIKETLYPRITNHLDSYLSKKISEGYERLQKYVSSKAPKYRPILHRIPKDKLIVDPDISDRDLDLFLHKHLSEIEKEMLKKGHELMTPKDDEDTKGYQSRLQDYINTLADFKKSDLASYVSHRKVIIDLFESAIQRQPDGGYVKEEIIHELIMPMRVISDEVSLESCNLWLIDESLAFHDFLASDKTLKSMPVTESTESKEPDIFAINVCDNPILISEGQKLPLASIVVVEIKRPMRNDAKAGEDKDPIEQALGYLNRIRNGKVKTAGGRLIPDSNDIPGYCYILCDITQSIKDRCELLDLTVTSDHMGYFGFHKKFKSYIEVISFDRLINNAKERNRAFFDKLGLPTS